MICVPESTANVWVLTVKNAIKTMRGSVIIDIYRLLTHFKAFSSASKRPASGSLAEKPTENPSLSIFFF